MWSCPQTSPSSARAICRPERPSVDGGVKGRPVGDPLAVALDEVLVAEARTAHVAAASVDPERVREARRREVAHVGLQDECLEALVAQRLVAAGKTGEVLDAGELEPDEVDRVVDDPLRVRLREAHLDVGGEREPFHAGKA